MLFEIATIGPGFVVDEDAEHLGERWCCRPRSSTCGPDRADADAAPTRAPPDELVTLERHRSTRPAEGEPGGTPRALPRRGADERDLYPLLDPLDPERRLLGVTLAAHWRCRPAARTGTGSGASPPPTRSTPLSQLRGGGCLARRPARADRARRDRRLLPGSGDELGARARRGPAAAGGNHGALRLHARGRRLRARSLRSGRLSRRRRPRLARPRDPGRVRSRGGGARPRGGRRPPLARDARAPHDRPARAAGVAGVRRGCSPRIARGEAEASPPPTSGRDTRDG